MKKSSQENQSHCSAASAIRQLSLRIGISLSRMSSEKNRSVITIRNLMNLIVMVPW